jgi:hypothetical protein
MIKQIFPQPQELGWSIAKECLLFKLAMGPYNKE